jgi:argininosuccinate lyase
MGGYLFFIAIMKVGASISNLNATDLEDYLAKKGLPVRQAPEVSGKSVHYCIENNKWLMDLSLETIKAETCVENRNSFGGISYKQVELNLKTAKKIMGKHQAVIDAYNEKAISL